MQEARLFVLEPFSYSWSRTTGHLLQQLSTGFPQLLCVVIGRLLLTDFTSYHWLADPGRSPPPQWRSTKQKARMIRQSFICIAITVITHLGQDSAVGLSTGKCNRLSRTCILLARCEDSCDAKGSPTARANSDYGHHMTVRG